MTQPDPPDGRSAHVRVSHIDDSCLERVARNGDHAALVRATARAIGVFEQTADPSNAAGQALQRRAQLVSDEALEPLVDRDTLSSQSNLHDVTSEEERAP